MNFKNEKLSREDSKELFESFISSGINDFIDRKYNFIRRDFLSQHNSILLREIKNKSYEYDLNFALFLYQYFKKNGFTLRDASNDSFWRYFSMKIIPDIVYSRWGYNENRFWKEKRRLWLKTLWWYIYLSWQLTEKDTYEILKNYDTDIIQQLIERPGTDGYRVKYSRILMKEYSKIPSKYKNMNNEGRSLFRNIMKLNTARVQVIEPGLAGKSELEYIIDSIKYLVPELEKNYEYTRGN